MLKKKVEILIVKERNQAPAAYQLLRESLGGPACIGVDCEGTSIDGSLSIRESAFLNIYYLGIPLMVQCASSTVVLAVYFRSGSRELILDCV